MRDTSYGARLIVTGTPGPVILHNGYRIPQVFGGSSAGDGFQWPERTTPRTDRPVRFVYLSNERAYRPRLARGYMQSVRPVHFPA